jgi:NADH dehydrogenase
VENAELNVVTGAFGYTGKYIARRLLASGKQVRTLTRNSASDSPFGDQIEVRPLDFDDPTGLTESLRGATALYNTYWVRFPYGSTGFDQAVRNSKTLIKAAEEAGVQRLVHISITNASDTSTLPYFRGKGQVENAIRSSGLSYAIIRPTVIFGAEDVLINNIAWFLRRFPIFPIGGTGEYPVQPVFVEDVAQQAVTAADEETNVVLDAVGPETLTYNEMVKLIASHVGGGDRLVHVPPRLAIWLARVAGYLVRDVVLTQDEIDGLMAGHLVSTDAAPLPTKFSSWLGEQGGSLGKHYVSELRRHYR